MKLKKGNDIIELKNEAHISAYKQSGYEVIENTIVDEMIEIKPLKEEIKELEMEVKKEVEYKKSK